MDHPILPGEILPERADKLPEVPNDPGHPLRPFVFRWYPSSHIDGRTWYGDTSRDEFHGVQRIERHPRSRRPGQKHNRPMGVRYRFDGEEEEVTYEALVERLRARHGEFVGRVQDHPLVAAWRRGEEIAWEPAPAPFPVGSTVRRSGAGLAAMGVEDEAFLAKVRSRTYEVVQAHALYSQVQHEPGREQWIANRLLEPVDKSTVEG